MNEWRIVAEPVPTGKLPTRIPLPLWKHGAIGVSAIWTTLDRSRFKCAPPRTRIPDPSAPSSHVPLPGPRTVSLVSPTDARPKISTIELVPSRPGTSVRGARMIVTPRPAPLIRRALWIVTCSTYVPGSTLIVSPGLAASTADWIVGYAEGTTSTDREVLPAAESASRLMQTAIQRARPHRSRRRPCTRPTGLASTVTSTQPRRVEPSSVGRRRRLRIVMNASRMSARTNPFSAPWRLAALRPSRATRSSHARR